MQSVLMVCVGNICRSPMAEMLLRARLTEQGTVVASAGVGALVGHGVDPQVQRLMMERGLDASMHRARQLSSEMALNSDLILTMNRDLKQHIEAMFPETKGRVQRLGHWGGFDIPDPFQRPSVIFEQARALIDQALDEWCDQLWN